MLRHGLFSSNHPRPAPIPVAVLALLPPHHQLTAIPRHFQPKPRSSAARAPLVGSQRPDAALAAPPVPPPPAAFAHTRPQSTLDGVAPLQQKQQVLAPPSGAVAYASSTAPVSMESDISGSTLSFGSYVDEVPGSGAQGPPRSALLPGGTAGEATFVFGSAGATQQVAPVVLVPTVVQPVTASLVEERAVPLPATTMVAPVVAVDELGKLLEKLNMTKYRPKFSSKQVRGVLMFRVLDVRACV